MVTPAYQPRDPSHTVLYQVITDHLEVSLAILDAMGYDPLGEDEPGLARTMAASVQQRIAFGERAGQKVRRIGSGFGYEGQRPVIRRNGRSY